MSDLRNARAVAGLFAGADYAVDAAQVREELYSDAKAHRGLGIGFSGFGAGAAAGGIVAAVGATRADTRHG